MILRLHKAKGWSGLLGLLEVMHWEWRKIVPMHTERDFKEKKEWRLLFWNLLLITDFGSGTHSLERQVQTTRI